MRLGDDYDVHAFGLVHQVHTMQPASPRARKRAVAKTLGEVPAVAALTAHAKALDALDRTLRQLLPEPLRHQCCLADLRAGRLVFLAKSPVWAAKLRLQQNALLAQARKVAGAPIEKFTVKVAPLPPVPPGQIRRKPLSLSAAEHLRAAAHSAADPELRAAYLRLASLAEISSSREEAP
jgi:hypothetical protein